jgi:hypothetical protein
MFVSSKYAILGFPRPIVSTPFRPSQGNFANPNLLRVWPGARPRQSYGPWIAFVLAVTCLMVAASPCGSGVIVSGIGGSCPISVVISQVNVSGHTSLLAGAVQFPIVNRLSGVVLSHYGLPPIV